MILEKNASGSNYCTKVGLVYILVVFSLISSCVTQRDIEYMQGGRHDEIKSFFDEAEYFDYRIKPSDELYIQISSLDEASASVFSNTREQSIYAGSMQPYGASLLSYAVDKEGLLHMPIVGEIMVKDKTLSEVSTILKDSLTHVLNQPIVNVKLVNRYVSILGEVAKPGLFPYAQEKLSIYDALALAGDITVYGNRKDVILVRNEGGKNIRINVNLNNSNILSADYYNLRPNDMIYVKPLNKKFWGMSQFPYAIILSTITTALLIYSVIK
jgi:polysaccharide biosynthesis/export protein